MSLFYFDNLTATLMGGTILLIVLTMQVRLRDVNIEQTSLAISKKQAIQLGEWLQKDLSNVGYGVELGVEPIQEKKEDPATENTTRFSYLRKINEGDASPVQVTYELITADSMMVGGEKVYFYQALRCVDASTCSPTSSKLAGQSPPYLRSFRIDPLDASGSDWTGTGAHFLRVQFSFSSNLTDDPTHMREAFWGTVLPLRDPDS